MIYDERQVRRMVYDVATSAVVGVTPDIIRRVEQGVVSRVTGMLAEAVQVERADAAKEVQNMIRATMATYTKKEDEPSRLALSLLEKRLKARFGIP